jgi:hypothetical protein
MLLDDGRVKGKIEWHHGKNKLRLHLSICWRRSGSRRKLIQEMIARIVGPKTDWGEQARSTLLES